MKGPTQVVEESVGECPQKRWFRDKRDQVSSEVSSKRERDKAKREWGNLPKTQINSSEKTASMQKEKKSYGNPVWVSITMPKTAAL